jgi:hypothetical protein
LSGGHRSGHDRGARCWRCVGVLRALRAPRGSVRSAGLRRIFVIGDARRGSAWARRRRWRRSLLRAPGQRPRLSHGTSTASRTALYGLVSRSRGGAHLFRRAGLAQVALPDRWRRRRTDPGVATLFATCTPWKPAEFGCGSVRASAVSPVWVGHDPAARVAGVSTWKRSLGLARVLLGPPTDPARAGVLDVSTKGSRSRQASSATCPSAAVGWEGPEWITIPPPGGSQRGRR